MLWLKNNVIFNIDFQPYGTYNIGPCTKDTYDYTVSALYQKATPSDVIEGVRRLIVELPCQTPIISACRVFLYSYVKAIDEYCKADFEKYCVPEHMDEVEGDEDEEKEPLRFPINSYGERMVREHTGMSFKEIQNLDILTYKFYEAEAFKIAILQRVDGKGTNYLNECFDYMQARRENEANLQALLEEEEGE